MRRVSLASAVILLLLLAYRMGQRSPRAETEHTTARKILYYTDPMHPDYKSDKPGIAPDCGMQLVPVFAKSSEERPVESSLPAADAGSVEIDTPTQQLLGIRLETVKRAGLVHLVRMAGRVMPEDTHVYSINSGVDGFVKETLHDSVGTLVRKDQVLAMYYSPDYLSAASGFLAASERIPGAVGREAGRNIDSYTNRLRNLGMSDLQIRHIADTRQLPDDIQMVSPVDGFISARNISPGQHFMRDTEFYRISDLSRVWIVADVFSEDASRLKDGAAARISLRDQHMHLPAVLSASLPQSEAGGGTVKLRFEANNPNFFLRPDMIVDVEAPLSLPEAVTVPIDAVIESGAHARVYVARGNGHFAPREVETGWFADDRVQIRTGLEPGETVVASATFLIDSESRMHANDAQIPKSNPEKRTAQRLGSTAKILMGARSRGPSIDQ